MTEYSLVHGQEGESLMINWCCFLVTQMVKNLPAMQETRVPSLAQEDPLEKEMAIHSSILTWETEETAGFGPCSHKELDTTK